MCFFPWFPIKKKMEHLVQKKKGYMFTGCFNGIEVLLALVTFSFQSQKERSFGALAEAPT